MRVKSPAAAESRKRDDIASNACAVDSIGIFSTGSAPVIRKACRPSQSRSSALLQSDGFINALLKVAVNRRFNKAYSSIPCGVCGLFLQIMSDLT